MVSGSWWRVKVRVVVFDATFNNSSAISWRSVLLVKETGENHRPVASHWQTLSHNDVSSTPRHEREFELSTLVVIHTDCTGSSKSNYHTITTTTAPEVNRPFAHFRLILKLYVFLLGQSNWSHFMQTRVPSLCNLQNST